MEAPPALSQYAITFDYCHWTYFVGTFSLKQVTVCVNDATSLFAISFGCCVTVSLLVADGSKASPEQRPGM